MNTFSDKNKKLILPNEKYLTLPKLDELKYSHNLSKSRSIEEEPDGGLVKKLFTKNLKRQNLHFWLKTVNPQVCRIVGLVCTFLFILQLRISKSNREVLLSFGRVIGLLSSGFGLLFSLLFLILFSNFKKKLNKK